MLTALHSKASSWVVKILLVILVISFAIWGVNDFLRQAGEKERAVATVGNEDVLGSDLRSRLNSIVGNISRQSGVAIDSQQAKQYGLDKMALNQLIDERMYSVYGAKLGIRLPIDMINQRIMSYAVFRDPQGNFDPDRFATYLRTADVSEAQFAEELRVNTIKSFVIGSLNNGIGTPNILAETLYAARNEQRVAKTLLIADSSITEQFTPDDATLTKFHADNSGNYQAPEYRGVTLVRLDPETLIGQMTVDDNEIADAYQADMAKYMLPETRDVAAVTYPDEDSAKAAFEQLKSGRNLADVAQAGGNTVDANTGVTLEALTEKLGDAVAKAAFGVAPGATTEPVQGESGWVIAQATKVTAARQQELPEVKDAIKRDLALLHAQDEILQLGEEFEDKRGGGMNLEAAAEALKLPVVKIAATDSAGRDEAGAAIAGVSDNQSILQIIQSTEEGQETRLEDGGNGLYFALRVDRITPAATRPLDKVRDKVIADWQASKRREAAAAKAQELAQRLQGGETLDKIATELSAAVQTSEPFTRRTSEPSANLSAALVSKAFELKVGDAASGRAGTDDGELLVVLSEIRPVDLSKRSVEIADLRDEMKRLLADDIDAQLGSAIRNEIGVSIDQTAIDTLF
jgi:peptidyl-prolyl cis-trans isomerase D